MSDHDHRKCPNDCKCCTPNPPISIELQVPDTYRGKPVPRCTPEEES